MKYSKFLFAFTITLIFSTFTFAQSKLYGKVTEVINGKTLTIEPQKGLKVQLELELIEVPEPEQQLHQIVKEHLEKLVLNKYVEFRPKGLSETKTIGQVLLDGVNISQQMIRDGAAWYDITRKTSQTQDEVEFYQTIQFQAKAEKRGIWSIADLKPAWEFRAEKEELERERDQAELDKKREELNAKTQNSTNRKKKRLNYENKIILPDNILNTKYINADTETPKGFVVIGIGYLTKDEVNLLKVIKKPQEGDLVCAGELIPSSFITMQIAYSKLCPSASYGNNANYITNASAYSETVTREIIGKLILAYRIYRISGNWEAFEQKAMDAIDTTKRKIQYVEEGNMKENLLMASEILLDAKLVSSSRRGYYGAKLGGDALIALNDKYGLNDVPAYSLDREIIGVGIKYLNNATREAKRLGII